MMSCYSLKPLRTKAEAESSPKLGQFLVISAPTRKVSVLLSVSKVTDSHGSTIPLHLRRVVQYEHLPDYIRSKIHERHSEVEDPAQDAAQDHRIANTDNSTVYVVYMSVASLPGPDLDEHLQLLQKDQSWLNDLAIYTFSFPLLPPTTEEQATVWSYKYWPVIYRKHNPYGPQHNIVTAATAEITGTANRYMRLAESIGEASFAGGVGRPVGAIIVSRNAERESQIVAVAGDARWYTGCNDGDKGSGNCMAHAAMRAIAIVAEKRRAAENGSPGDVLISNPNDSFMGCAITQAEVQHYSNRVLEVGGYLCLDLEIYLSHEPCVMCSMALLHSRFGKVVFGKRMLLTGGLFAEHGEGQGYGLFWLPSLNWKLLAWQWTAASGAGEESERVQWHA